MLIAFAIMFGLIDYSTVPVTVSYVASRMGVGVVGVSMGLLSAVHAVGGALGASAGGVFFDVSGSSTSVWVVSLMLALVAAADRKSVVEGKSVTERVDIGGGSIINKINKKQQIARNTSITIQQQ